MDKKKTGYIVIEVTILIAVFVYYVAKGFTKRNG